MKQIVNNVIKKMQTIIGKNELMILKETLEKELNRKQTKDKKNNMQLLEDFIKSKV